MAGKVEYERRVNVHAQMEGNEWMEKFKSQVTKFSDTYFDMVFDTGRTLYKPGREPETPNKMWNANGAAPENVVYTNITQKRVTALKAIFETKFLVKDSMRKIEWKEKEGIRTIAGHPCHKAVGVICDSVYVVAFYAEDIPVSGGPEMFGGLPGLILELAIPRLHTTWNATKIELAALTEADFKEPEKGKKVNNKELQESIKSSFADWGKNASRYVLWTLL
jgi:GLPGLI family protein